MAKWVADDRDWLDLAAADIAGMFAEAELRLVKVLALQARSGLANHPDDMTKALRLAELRDAARTVATRLQEATPAEVDAIIHAAANQGTATALRELAALAGVTDLTAVTTPLGAQAAQALVMDLTSKFDDVTRRILRWPDDIYRQAVAGSTTDLLLGLGATTQTAQARAWQQLISQGVTGFIDKADRKWNLATYVEMATRTASRRAWSDQHLQTMQDYGMDLVSIVVGSDACRPCSEWAGKVLRSRPGATGVILVDRVDGPGQIQVDVAGTLDDAREQGWSHPNCRCRPVAYLPGLSVVADATTYDPYLEGEREQLRALEREVRKAKVDEAASVDDVQLREARRRRLELQGRIRAHVADTGLVRKRYREQISLGRRAAPWDGPTTH